MQRNRPICTTAKCRRVASPIRSHLPTDEAKTSKSAHTSFLQISSKSDFVSFGAAQYIRDLGKKQHSTALLQFASRLASTIRLCGSNKEDVVAKIKGLISDFITKLEVEAGAEKALCDKELSDTSAKKDDKTGEIEKVTAQINELTSESKILKEEVTTLQAELGALTISG